MSTRKTFPTKKADLAVYLAVVIPYIVANSARLGIAGTVVTALTDFYGDITTADTYLYLFTKWSDKTGGRTKQVISNLKLAEIQMKKMLTDIYNDIPASKWTENDRNTFNRKTGAEITHTPVTKPIKEQCFAIATALGGGKIEVKCRSTEDASRSSLPENADGVEIAHAEVTPEVPDNSETNGQIKIIDNPEATNLTRKVHTQAHFVVTLAPTEKRKEMQFFTRWVNTKHDDISGPWTGPYTVTIT